MPLKQPRRPWRVVASPGRSVPGTGPRKPTQARKDQAHGTRGGSVTPTSIRCSSACPMRVACPKPWGPILSLGRRGKGAVGDEASRSSCINRACAGSAGCWKVSSGGWRARRIAYRPEQYFVWGGLAGCWGRTQGGGSILDLLKVRLDLLHHPWRQDISGGKVDLQVGLGFGFGLGFG